MAETNSNKSLKTTTSAAVSKPSAKAKAASSSAKSSRTLTPSELAFMRQYAQEAAKKRREANRMSPEELAEYTRELTAAHARRMDEHLRALYPGAAVLTTGGCTLCEECTRPMGRPCRHPQAVGYSLESLGCDVGAAARGELGWELLWPRRDKLPRYLTLLCAVLR